MDKVIERYAKAYRRGLEARGFDGVDGMVAAYRERLREMYASDAYREHDVYPSMSVEHYGIRGLCKIFCMTDERAYAGLTRHVRFVRHSDLSDAVTDPESGMQCNPHRRSSHQFHVRGG